jgi:hypothetical protein
VAAIHHAEDALPQRLLHLFHEGADLVEELGLDVVSKPTIRLASCVAVELRVEGVAAQNLFEWALELVWQQLEQLLLDLAKHPAEFQTYCPVYFGKACT